MEWSGGREWGEKKGKVGRWGDIMEGGGRMGGWEDGRMGWERGCRDRGLSGVLGRKEGDVVVV